jgi:hypothetical protein
MTLAVVAGLQQTPTTDEESPDGPEVPHLRSDASSPSRQPRGSPAGARPPRCVWTSGARVRRALRERGGRRRLVEPRRERRRSCTAGAEGSGSGRSRLVERRRERRRSCTAGIERSECGRRRRLRCVSTSLSDARTQHAPRSRLNAAIRDQVVTDLAPRPNPPPQCRRSPAKSRNVERSSDPSTPASSRPRRTRRRPTGRRARRRVTAEDDLAPALARRADHPVRSSTTTRIPTRAPAP